MTINIDCPLINFWIDIQNTNKVKQKSIQYKVIEKAVNVLFGFFVFVQFYRFSL